MILARVKSKNIEDRQEYRFWKGDSGWDHDYKEATPLLTDIQQGSVFKSALFGEDARWVFIGCNKWCDSKVLLSTAASPEGPWGDFTVIHTAQGLDHCEGNMYCMYPHPWAFPNGNELMVTWNEGGVEGGVVAAKIKFKLQS